MCLKTVMKGTVYCSAGPEHIHGCTFGRSHCFGNSLIVKSSFDNKRIGRMLGKRQKEEARGLYKFKQAVMTFIQSQRLLLIQRSSQEE